MEFLTAREAAELWDIAIRRVQSLCESGRVCGAVRFGREWAIPKGAKKPSDLRHGAYGDCRDCPSLPPPSAYGGLFEKIVRQFPYPVHIAASDGMFVEANEAFFRFFQVSGKDKTYREYNILLDPDLGKWGIKGHLQKAFQGEIVEACDIKVPVRDLVQKFSGEGLSDEEIYQNITSFPIFDSSGELKYVVTVFFMSRLYTGQEAIRKSKAYMDSHWLETFDIDKIADSVFLSKYYFSRLFKKHTGITPYNYYHELKIRKLKEALRDKRKTVSQAFADCGLDYSGYYSKLFKERVGMTPSQFRSSGRE